MVVWRRDAYAVRPRTPYAPAFTMTSSENWARSARSPHRIAVMTVSSQGVRRPDPEHRITVLASGRGIRREHSLRYGEHFGLRVERVCRV